MKRMNKRKYQRKKGVEEEERMLRAQVTKRKNLLKNLMKKKRKSKKSKKMFQKGQLGDKSKKLRAL